MISLSGRLEVNLETHGQHIIADTALSLRVDGLLIVGSRLSRCVVANQQLALSVGITVVVRVLIVENGVSSGEKLSCY